MFLAGLKRQNCGELESVDTRLTLTRDTRGRVFNLLLIPIPDSKPAWSKYLAKSSAPGELTREDVTTLSHQLELHVRMSEALVEFVMVIAGRPSAN